MKVKRFIVKEKERKIYRRKKRDRTDSIMKIVNKRQKKKEYKNTEKKKRQK